MARRPSKHLRPARPLSSGHAAADEKQDGRWVVRSMSGAATEKTYRCPGCSQTIAIGTPHIVAWPADPAWHAGTGPEQRRHWHTACWQRRP